MTTPPNPYEEEFPSWGPPSHHELADYRVYVPSGPQRFFPRSGAARIRYNDPDRTNGPKTPGLVPGMMPRKPTVSPHPPPKTETREAGSHIDDVPSRPHVSTRNNPYGSAYRTPDDSNSVGSQGIKSSTPKQSTDVVPELNPYEETP